MGLREIASESGVSRVDGAARGAGCMQAMGMIRIRRGQRCESCEL